MKLILLIFIFISSSIFSETLNQNPIFEYTRYFDIDTHEIILFPVEQYISQDYGIALTKFRKGRGIVLTADKYLISTKTEIKNLDDSFSIINVAGMEANELNAIKEEFEKERFKGEKEINIEVVKFKLLDDEFNELKKSIDMLRDERNEIKGIPQVPGRRYLRAPFYFIKSYKLTINFADQDDSFCSDENFDDWTPEYKEAFDKINVQMDDIIEKVDSYKKRYIESRIGKSQIKYGNK